MDPGDDAYDILGVPKDATAVQIKSAYRKLALKHHPDKQSTDEARQRSTLIFVKLSNAYEILKNESTRRDYDQERERERQSSTTGPSYNDWEEQPSRARPSSSSSRRAPAPAAAHQHDHFYEHFRFHDPFQVFEQVFGQDFSSRARTGHSAFNDPFFSDGNINRGGGFGAPSMFGSMMGGGMMGGGDPFFGGGGFGGRNMNMNMNMNRGSDPFAAMHQSMMSSMPMHNSSSAFYGSNSVGNFPGASSVSTSTTTSIVNGRAQTVTETIVHKPDGTVERHVQKQGRPEEPPARRQPQRTAGTNDASPPRRGIFGALGGGRKKANDSEPASSSSSRGKNPRASSRQRSSSNLEEESAPEHNKRTKHKNSKK